MTYGTMLHDNDSQTSPFIQYYSFFAARASCVVWYIMTWMMDV